MRYDRQNKAAVWLFSSFKRSFIASYSYFLSLDLSTLGLSLTSTADQGSYLVHLLIKIRSPLLTKPSLALQKTNSSPKELRVGTREVIKKWTEMRSKQFPLGLLSYLIVNVLNVEKTSLSDRSYKNSPRYSFYHKRTIVHLSFMRYVQ